MSVRMTAGAAPAWVAGRLGQLSGTRWIGVDGFGAAGKTTLAHAVAAALPAAQVIGIDDFARAGVPGWDRELFARHVLEPLLAGRPGRYQRWDLAAERPLEWVEVQPGQALVVEGVSSTDRRLPVHWDVTIWVEAARDTRWRRILARDDPALIERWQTDWLPSEQAYAAEQRPWERVDACVVGQ